MYFPGSFFWPFFKDFPKEITFFKLLYKTFYSQTLRLLEPLISYFDSREKVRRVVRSQLSVHLIVGSSILSIKKVFFFGRPGMGNWVYGSGDPTNTR